MEVSSVFPSPFSPSDGDDLCETDVTSVAMHSVTQLICICGLAGNGTVISLLKLKIPNSGVFDLAVIDFLFLIIMVPSNLLFLVEDVSCSPIKPLMYMNFVFQLPVVSCYWARFWLMRSRNVLYMDKLCKLYCRWDLPKCLLWVLDSVQYWAFFGLFTVIPMVTFLGPSHKQEHCCAPLISMYAIVLLLFAAPVTISGRILLIKAKWGCQQQQPKRCDIVIVITLLFTLLLILWNFLQQLSYIAVCSQVVFLLTSINSSIKPFIYFLAGQCWRPCSMGSLQLSLQRVFEEQREIKDCRNDPAMDTAI